VSPDRLPVEHPARGGSEAGFSLVALFAAMTIMLILMGAAMPSWKYVMQNEREQELYFRGGQIADAIERYQRKNANTAPPSLEVLVKGRYLRKAYADPMTKDGKWRMIRVGEVLGMTRRRELDRLRGRGPASPSPSPKPSSSTIGGTLGGPFIGVASFSTDKSLRVMNGAESYDEWLFVAGKPRVLGRQSQAEIVGGIQGSAPVAPGQAGPPPAATPGPKK
jgi:type II secretory pathway pseudopilin PulG